MAAARVLRHCRGIVHGRTVTEEIMGSNQQNLDSQVKVVPHTSESSFRGSLGGIL